MIFIQKSDCAVLLVMALLLNDCTNPPEATHEPYSRQTRKREQPANNGQNSIYWIKDTRLCDELGGKIDAGDGICRL